MFYMEKMVQFQVRIISLIPILRCLFYYTDIFSLILALPPGASIILSSTVSPAYVSQLEHRLQSMLLLQ